MNKTYRSIVRGTAAPIVRSIGNTTISKAWNGGLDAADLSSITAGQMGQSGGGAITATGVSVTAVSGGLAAEVSVPVALGGLGISTVGTILKGNGANNLASQNGRVNTEGEEASTKGNNPREGQPFLVTPQGVVLPQGAVIPEHLEENEHRPGNYGTRDEKGKYQEKVRVDPGTPSGKKGPNDSHFHLDKGDEHIMDPNRWPWWLNIGRK